MTDWSFVKKQREEINELTHKHHNEAGQIAKYSDALRRYSVTLENIDKLIDVVRSEIND